MYNSAATWDKRSIWQQKTNVPHFYVGNSLPSRDLQLGELPAEA